MSSKIGFDSPKDAMPWVGLYVGVASLVCTLAMMADAIHGIRQGKPWFPCKFFTLNVAYITLIGIAMKLPVDLTIDIPHDDMDAMDVKNVSVYFLVTMFANFLPSFGLMDEKELLANTIALGLLTITIMANVFMELITSKEFYADTGFLICSLVWVFSVALMVPSSRRTLEQRFKDSRLHELASIHSEPNFSSKKLLRYVKRYWMIAETSNPQFVIACSPVSYAFGVVCSLLACISLFRLFDQLDDLSDFWSGKSDYKWSMGFIMNVQSVGVVVGSIAPVFRCLTGINYFNLSKKWCKNHLNVFKVEKHWIQMLQQWKLRHVSSHIPGRRCKIVFRTLRNMILNFCIAHQIMIVVICKIICLAPRSFLVLFSCGWYSCKSRLKRFEQKPIASNIEVRSEMKQHNWYVLENEDEAELSERILRNRLKSLTRLLRASEKKEPNNLMELLKKSTGFNGVAEFDNDQVPPLHSEKTQYSWSLVVVNLAAIVVALPNVANDRVKGFFAGLREGLQIVTYIEENLNENSELVKAIKAARHVWTEVETYRTWLQINLQTKRTSKEILQWLSDEAVKIVIEFNRRKNGSLDHSLLKFIVASSMYRISQTILLHCNKQEIWPTDEEISERIWTIVADLLCACFTNLPRAITLSCHHNAIEKREYNIWNAARLLGKSKKILKFLKVYPLPNLDMDSMAYVDKWLALPKSRHDSINMLSSNESFIVTIV